MLKTDAVRDVDTLTQLLTENPANRTAYQYGMASLLLSKNLDNFVRMFDMYHQRNFARIPRHYEEALLLFECFGSNRRTRRVGSSPRRPGASFRSSPSRCSANRRGSDDARLALRKRFGSTYFYYYFLGT